MAKKQAYLLLIIPYTQSSASVLLSHIAFASPTVCVRERTENSVHGSLVLQVGLSRMLTGYSKQKQPSVTIIETH